MFLYRLLMHVTT